MAGSSSAKTRFALLPGHDKRRGVPSNSRSHSRGGIRPSFARLFAPSECRGRRESRMPAASDSLVYERSKKYTSFSHYRISRTSGLPCTTNMRRLMPALPGGPLLCRRRALVLRLAVRSDDFAFARLDAVGVSIRQVLPSAACIGRHHALRPSLHTEIRRSPPPRWSF